MKNPMHIRKPKEHLKKAIKVGSKAIVDSRRFGNGVNMPRYEFSLLLSAAKQELHTIEGMEQA